MDEPSERSSSKHKSSHRDKERKRSRSRDRKDKPDRKDRSDKKHHSSRSDRSPDSKDRKHHDKKRRTHDKEDKHSGMTVVDDEDDAAVWVEKAVDQRSAAQIPTSEPLSLTSHASQPTTATLPRSTIAASSGRESWMMEEEEPVSSGRAGVTDDGADVEGRATGGGSDFFTALGTTQSSRKEKEAVQAQVVVEEPRFHRREINTRLIEGESEGKSFSTPSAAKPVVAGAPGSQWRMTKLRRTYEVAAAESRSIEEVAIERYGTLKDFEEAVEEKRILDERAGRRESRGRTGPSGGSAGGASGSSTPGQERYMFTSDAALSSGGGSRPGSRAGFRRPGEEPGAPGSSSSTGACESFTSGAGAVNRVDSLRRAGSFQSPSQPSTPIPSVLMPTQHRPAPPTPLNLGKPALSPSELNKLQAAVLKARLMDSPDASRLEAEYDAEMARARRAAENGASVGHAQDGGKGKSREGAPNGDEVRVEMMPTLDGRGKLYDVGLGGKEEAPLLPGNRRKVVKVETRDPKTGDLLRLNADDDTTTLGDLVRAERFGAGSSDQKNMDAEMAKAIANDGMFKEGNDYLDENADRLARKKMKTDASKRLYAINDYARTRKALDSCLFCPKDEDGPPRAAVIAMGTKAYLACTQTEELVDGHVIIVPLQHTLTSLEGDDDFWDEIRNFMKCLMKMFAEQEKGVLFYETVLSFKQQKHTYIEAVPMPWEMYEDAPAYFREAILSSETEWSQHKKLIDFSSRPGGFRRALVSNLPYFMVQWDYKGEKGYGHVIEGVSDSSAKAGEGEDQGMVDEGDKGGGEFPRYFAAEIIGSMLELEPRKWRKPRKMDSKQDKARVEKFLKSGYAKHDWTGMLGRKGD